ncbi:collagen alpha-1(III) chain-like [Vulpes lagopus]|uniref:collagen alpha-1(III) chain-like n=1 Tax=Vulpes lagopus TaxID=494514 RepID=UPI001BC960F7|nr:collagen alpha-1(III) chain-like [Vulpes lagopus]
MRRRRVGGGAALAVSGARGVRGPAPPSPPPVPARRGPRGVAAEAGAGARAGRPGGTGGFPEPRARGTRAKRLRWGRRPGAAGPKAARSWPRTTTTGVSTASPPVRPERAAQADRPPRRPPGLRVR